MKTIATYRLLAGVPTLMVTLLLTTTFPQAAKAQTWTAVNASSIKTGTKIKSGRVNAAGQNPSNPNIVYLGTDGGRPTGSMGNPNGHSTVGLFDTGGGGVWRTTNWLDANPSWTPLTDSMPSLSVGVHGLAMAAGNPKLLYAAADGPAGCILKTTNGGDTWTALATDLFANVKFGGIAISPNDPNTVYVAVFRGSGSTSGGVYKTTDGGAHWSLAGGMAGDVSHVAVNPSHPNIVYAGFVDPGNPSQQGVWKSTDGGGSWRQQNGNFPLGTFSSTLYIEFAIAPSAPQIVYAVVMQPQNKPLPLFYRTADGGAHWTKLCVTATKGRDNRYWHQVLTVNPSRPNLVYAEGVNHFGVLTTRGGMPQPGGSCSGVWNNFWTGDDPAGVEFFSNPGVPGGRTMAAFGDRGVYEVTHPDHPNQKSDFFGKQGNLANLLLVSLAVSPVDASTVYGVAVDQSSALRTSSAMAPYWSYTNMGGEFGKYLTTPGHPNIVYHLKGHSLPEMLQRSTDGGATWASISKGLTDADFPSNKSLITDAAVWKAFEIDSSNADGLLLGTLKVHSWNMTSNNWTTISPCLMPGQCVADANSFISALGVTPAAPRQIYAATSQGTLFVTQDRSSWPAITSLALPAGSFISRIEVSPATAATLAIAVQGTTGSGRVWTSTNSGGSWTDLTGNLPSGLQVYTVVVDWAANPAQIFAGTDRGVYLAPLSGGSWQIYGTGLPNTLVSDLRIDPAGTLTAGTLGHGAFQVSVATH